MNMNDRDAAIRDLEALARRDPTGMDYARDPAGIPAGTAPWVLWWGKAIAAWSAGNTVTLDPCLPDGTDIAGMTNVTAYIVSPIGGNPADSGLAPVIALNDALAYLPYGNNLAVLINPKWRVNVAGVIPIGGIIVWSGAIVDIPTGWALCDGNNGTPDFRDKFVLGAGTTAVDATGGFAQHGVTENNHSTHATHAGHDADHQHAAAGVHAHAWDTSPTGNYEGNTTTPPVDGSTHGDGNHQHPAAGGTLNHDAHAAHTDTDNRGPWYAKAWIMRTA